MAVAVIAHYPDLSAGSYDEVIASLDLDVNPPAGAILHVAGGDDGLVITEIWQTEETFRAFYDHRLRPALRMHGVLRDPVVEVQPLHNVYAPQMFTIERMGAVSLPLHAAGAAL
ncbi:hypothetical protein [Gaiella sp.]|jgi:hypothetical protein|uniref:hypothetical protein n=1 Tax=Gaiella sp. TaxID=2663207 RepID=UPI002E33A65A|nr:hypothetical protein [Gaiella sp.]HEX5582073.1 hypothetical protein [Gaiella sp.]